MQEVDGLAVDLGGELREGVELRFLCPPIEFGAPIPGELAESGLGDATLPAGAWQLGGPAGLGTLDADFDIVDSPELVTALRTLITRYQRAVTTAG